MPSHTRTTRDADAPATTTSTAATSAGNVLPEQDSLGNSAMAQIIRENNDYKGEQSANPNMTGIIHIGMNAHAADEATALNRANAGHGGAKSIRSSKEQDTLVRAGTKYDFGNEEDCARFAASLGAKPEQALAAAQLISGGGKYAKDELAQIVETYVQADLGLRKMDRVVFSGHSVGDTMWGDNNGDIPYDTYSELAQIFPRAAAQVKHLMLSACYAGGERNMQRFFAAFPNLQSIFAYHGSSPGTWSGAIQHLVKWEDATDEDGDASQVDPERVAGLRKAEYVATWNVKDGYQGGAPMDIWEIERDLESREEVFERYFSGASPVTNAQQGELRDYYNVVQRYLGHPEASADMATKMETRRDQTIRLLYWTVVTGKFGEAHSATLANAFQESGLSMPDWKKVSRQQFVMQMEEFLPRVAGNSQAMEAVRLLIGLRDLDPLVVLTAWV